MPKSRPGEVYSTDLPNAAISFDIDAFDQLLRSQGVTFTHYRAMKCPVGMIDEFDTRRPHEDHSDCSNGFLYTKAGEVTALFAGNSTSNNATEAGYVDGSTVNVTLPRFYDDGSEDRIYIAPFDRLYLAEEGIVVVNWQTYRHSDMAVDKLTFPVVFVQDLVDAQGRRYASGDFEIREGRIYWGRNRPGMDPETGRGLICSVRYTYRPYWYVKNLVHEVRVTQAEDPYTGVRKVQRMPQAIVLQREYIFEKNDRDDAAPDLDRQVKPPEPHRFGSRF